VFVVTYRPGTAAEAFERIDPVDDPDLCRWAAFFAAMVEWLCWTNETGCLPRPDWTANPAFAFASRGSSSLGWSLRAWQIFTTPVPFRLRNVFRGEDILSRV
jgi:hypothetical protein